MTHRCALCNQPLPDAPQLSLVAPASTKSRSGDPVTAKHAARLAVVRQGSQRFRLLAALETAGPSGLTAEQLADQTGLRYVSASTRCTELVRGNLAAVAAGTRPTSTGTPGQVLAITDAGRDELARVRAEQVAA
jgi:hypothetical protein